MRRAVCTFLVIYVYTLYTSRSEHEQNETKIQMDLENSNF